MAGAIEKRNRAASELLDLVIDPPIHRAVIDETCSIPAVRFHGVEWGKPRLPARQQQVASVRMSFRQRARVWPVYVPSVISTRDWGKCPPRTIPTIHGYRYKKTGGLEQI